MNHCLNLLMPFATLCVHVTWSQRPKLSCVIKEKTMNTPGMIWPVHSISVYNEQKSVGGCSSLRYRCGDNHSGIPLSYTIFLLHYMSGDENVHGSVWPDKSLSLPKDGLSLLTWLIKTSIGPTCDFNECCPEGCARADSSWKKFSGRQDNCTAMIKPIQRQVPCLVCVDTLRANFPFHRFARYNSFCVTPLLAYTGLSGPTGFSLNMFFHYISCFITSRLSLNESFHY